MVCIHCGQKTGIINSRLQKRSNQTWRRRKCMSCRAVFTTVETADYTASWLVQDKSIVPFSRDTLFLSLYEASKHRSHAVSDASALTDTVIRRLQPLVKDGTLKRSDIRRTAQVTLNRFDQASSLLYSALHK
jgi:transcriptional regulator NrdR family protein